MLEETFASEEGLVPGDVFFLVCSFIYWSVNSLFS